MTVPDFLCTCVAFVYLQDLHNMNMMIFYWYFLLIFCQRLPTSPVEKGAQKTVLKFLNEEAVSDKDFRLEIVFISQICCYISVASNIDWEF